MMKRADIRLRRHSAASEEELDSHLREAARLMMQSPAEVLRKGMEIADMAEHNDLPVFALKALYLCIEASDYLGKRNEMRGFIDRATPYASVLKDPAEKARAKSIIGTYYLECNEPRTAYLHLAAALNIIEKMPGQSFIRAQILLSLSGTYFKVGEYAKALTHAFSSLDCLHGSEHSTGIANILNRIGTIYHYMNDYEAAYKYYLKALKVYQETDNQVGRSYVLNDIGSLLIIAGDYQGADIHLNEALNLCRTLRTRGLYSKVLLNIGISYRQRGDIGQATAYFTEALSVTKEAGTPADSAEVLLELGYACRDSGETECACNYFNEGLSITNTFEHLDPTSARSDFHKALADLYTETGNTSEALTHLKEHLILREEILGSKTHRSIARVELLHAEQISRKEQEILQLRAEQVEQEMQTQRTYLHRIAITLAQRNEVLQSVCKTIEPFITAGRGKTRHLAKSVRDIIDSTTNDGTADEIFNDYVSALHEGALQRLHSEARTLSPAELKVCILIRMDFSTKQIADFLFVSMETVKSHRKNIRRKLGLDNSINLAAYLSTL